MPGTLAKTVMYYQARVSGGIKNKYNMKNNINLGTAGQAPVCNM